MSSPPVIHACTDLTEPSGTELSTAPSLFRWNCHRHPRFCAAVQIFVAEPLCRRSSLQISQAVGDPKLEHDAWLRPRHRQLFSTAFNLFKRMQQPRPTATAETYSMLLAAILRRFGKPPVSFVYLRAVRSLVREMKCSGVIPDTLTVNLIIKAFAQCLEMDEAVRIFKEMELYGCEPNEYSYGYLAKGLCEKGRIDDGIGYFKEMRGKGLVPTAMVYSVVVCSLAMEGRFEEAVEVVFDMLGNRVSPDVLTYRTVLEEMCRAGRADDAFKLLEELGGRPGAMCRRVYTDLLDGLHWLCQPHN